MSEDMVNGVNFFMMDELVVGDQIELGGDGKHLFMLVSLGANHYPGSGACCIISDATENGGADGPAGLVQVIGWDMADDPNLINWASFRTHMLCPGKGRLVVRTQDVSDEFQYITVNSCTIRRSGKVIFERSVYSTAQDS